MTRGEHSRGSASRQHKSWRAIWRQAADFSAVEEASAAHLETFTEFKNQLSTLSIPNFPPRTTRTAAVCMCRVDDVDAVGRRTAHERGIGSRVLN